MNILSRAALPAILAFFALAHAAWAMDIVQRKSTRSIVQGEITSISKTEIVVARNNSTVSVPANDIDRVRWDGEPPSLNLIRSAEESGRWTEALEGYVKAAGETRSNEQLQHDLQFLIARVNAQMALEGSENVPKLDEAIRGLEAFRNDHEDHFRSYDATRLLGRLYAAKGDLQKSQAEFAVLSRAPWPDYQMVGEIEQAKLLLEKDDAQGALALFDKVAGRSGDDPQVVAARQVALFGKIQCLTQVKQYDSALQSLAKVIDNASPEDQALQAKAHVLRGTCFEATGENQQAILSYLRADLIFPNQAEPRAEALFHLSRLWSAVGQPTRAADAAARLQGDYPQSSWTKKLRGQ